MSLSSCLLGAAGRAFVCLTLVVAALGGMTHSSSANDRAKATGKPSGPLQSVDLELVLAVDVSGSMNVEEQRLQREGYAAAFRDKDVITAIMSGSLRRIAVVYIEWSGSTHQNVRVPWTLIDSPGSARAFADRLSLAPHARGSSTSISAALIAAATSFDQNNFIGTRRVIDISGDGMNNQGPDIQEVRDAVLAHGIVINGLPIMLNDTPRFGSANALPLDVYFENCVIGGPRSFLVPVNDMQQFPQAIRKKLLLEISSTLPIITRAQFYTAPRQTIDCIPAGQGTKN